MELWGRVLGLPLLISDTDGAMHEAFARIGPLRIAAPTWRRRRRSAIARRRSSRLLRRRTGPAAQRWSIAARARLSPGNNFVC
jgi:hypothetical protein